MTTDEAYRELTERLSSEVEARWLVEEASGGWRPGRTVVALAPEEADLLEAMARRRLEGEPLQYVLGHWSFRTLELTVDPRVLIPRPETEIVVGVALEELAWIAGDREDPVVVDLGTGSGAIAFSLACEGIRDYPELHVVATDDDPGALAVAAQNLDALRSSFPGALVEMRQGAWWDALDESLRGKIDLVVSNPPYVSEAEWPELDEEVRREPRKALVAPDDDEGNAGLGCVVAILDGANEWLARPGVAVIELAPAQAEAAMAAALARGFDEARIERDLTDRERVLVAKRA